MRIEDVNQFKGQLKSAMQSWAESKVDELFANRASARVFMKNAVNNMMNRWDSKINSYIDTMFVFVADKDGIVDSDLMIDTLANLFKEMDERKYPMGMVDITVGKGQLVIDLPHNLFLEMLVGDLGKVRFTTEDIKEFKNILI
jgi:hypothetical protein